RFLNLGEPSVHITGFARPNLHFEIRTVAKRAEKYAALSRLIAERKTGIIYCATRKRVEEVASQLEEWEISHIAYHGGLKDVDREALQNEFISRRVDVAVATNAFGMGIDRADLRFVAHFEIPGSVEAYYQEAGRAGRDGLPSHCVLFYNYADRRTQDFFIEGANPSAEFIRDVYHQLLEVADGQTEIHRTIQELTELIGSKNGMAVGAALKVLGDLGLIERFDVPGERRRGTRLLRPEVLPYQIALDEAALAEKERRDRSKLDSVIAFANARECRQVWIRRYFGEDAPEACDRCDECRASRGADVRALDEEQTLILRKLLSGAARMSTRKNEREWIPRFGKGLLVQMLTGSDEQRLSQLGLRDLSTYGLLEAEGTALVRALVDAALRAGFLYSTGGTRPLLTLTPMGTAVMTGELTPELAWPTRREAPTAKGERPSGRRAAALQLEGSAPADDLLAALRRKRAELAKARGNMPAYTILTNRSLEALAAARPRTPQEAQLLSGIGPAKARSVVPAFLRIIEDWESTQG
ncbi:MAG: helicase-related protein, partial [Verrucomicrobiota bacterium]